MKQVNNKVSLSKLRVELRKKSSPVRAKILQGFFKTGKGEYGEGDVFLGVVVPELRKLARQSGHLEIRDIKKLLMSKFHEERLIALLILVDKYNGSDEKDKNKIYNYYLQHTKSINNWDLVDLSAPNIMGEYLLNKPKVVLSKLALSPDIWERRIAIIATLPFIRRGQYRQTLRIAKLLIDDKHDLIHKAVGWMLREVGKRSLVEEEAFLKKYHRSMPRTMLRYAIERFPEPKRKKYLSR